MLPAHFYLAEIFKLLHINISYTFFRISCTCRNYVSGTFEKCRPFFYLGSAQLEKLFSYLNENMSLAICIYCVALLQHKVKEAAVLHIKEYNLVHKEELHIINRRTGMNIP